MPELILQSMALLPCLWLGLCAREAAQAWLALRLGDPTAKEAGKISLYPPRHLDWIGSVFLPLGLIAVSHGVFIYGWAKPVPVDPARLGRPKRDYSLLALAGPLANLALAVLIAAAAVWIPHEGSPAVEAVLRGGIFANVMLGFLNLAPVPGLDGMKALFAFLPDRWCYRLNRPEPWFFLLLLLLLYAGALGWFFSPLLDLIRALCAWSGMELSGGYV